MRRPKATKKPLFLAGVRAGLAAAAAVADRQHRVMMKAADTDSIQLEQNGAVSRSRVDEFEKAASAFAHVAAAIRAIDPATVEDGGDGDE